MRKNAIFVLIILLVIFVITGCSTKKSENQYVTLKINMPLNFDDLDNIFETSMSSYLEEKEIGEIIGDGSPVDDYGPYATDIEFDIQKSKIEDFKKMLTNYRFPKGSYFVFDDYKSELFGDLVGIRLVFNNLSTEKIESIYLELSELFVDSYIYKTIYQVNDKTTVYYYGENIENLKNKISQYVEKHNLTHNISIMDMSIVIKEK